MQGPENFKYIRALAEAPILRIADYGIVGDLYQVIPAMVGEIGTLSCGIVSSYRCVGGPPLR